ncbi:hypothetical protein [Nocardia mexicana]|uniref:Uncharacterized protein n=1 Tax=Nocardia mexicana TaxID=279262 RepID=A0A370GNR3_9NOCA|nr:hypothetical protein [Nocardia mexicana]RDI45307.1 hypothetical protein DFR68_11377 [Nocardia mexicana]
MAVITHAADLVAWIETHLPDPGPGFGAWTTDPPAAGAVTATLHVRIHPAQHPPAAVAVALSTFPDVETVGPPPAFRPRTPVSAFD